MGLRERRPDLEHVGVCFERFRRLRVCLRPLLVRHELLLLLLLLLRLHGRHLAREVTHSKLQANTATSRRLGRWAEAATTSGSMATKQCLNPLMHPPGPDSSSASQANLKLRILGFLNSGFELTA